MPDATTTLPPKLKAYVEDLRSLEDKTARYLLLLDLERNPGPRAPVGRTAECFGHPGDARTHLRLVSDAERGAVPHKVPPICFDHCCVDAIHRRAAHQADGGVGLGHYISPCIRNPNLIHQPRPGSWGQRSDSASM